MSYGQNTLQAGDALHVIGFPDLLRLGAHRLQIQLANGCLSIKGQGMVFLVRDLLAGNLTTVSIGSAGTGVRVERIDINAGFLPDKDAYQIAECCPVPDDLILLETATSKDYLSRSELTFFGRLGRPNNTFVLGFRDRSYRVTALDGQADALMAAVLASKLASGTANIFTTLAPEYFLPWPEIYRHQVASIEETEYRPQDWNGNLFVAMFHLGVPVMSQTVVPPVQRPESGPTPSLEL
ncbi:MAG: hypothetical protein JSS11_09025 [Verrucomicrobia bacterium]|nr:hypothetical protein [Verrucomicrobiota bacterium]